MDPEALTNVLQQYRFLRSLTYTTDEKNNAIELKFQKSGADQYLVAKFEQIQGFSIIRLGLGNDRISEPAVIKMSYQPGEDYYRITNDKEFQYKFRCGHSAGDFTFCCTSFSFREFSE